MDNYEERIKHYIYIHIHNGSGQQLGTMKTVSENEAVIEKSNFHHRCCNNGV